MDKPAPQPTYAAILADRRQEVQRQLDPILATHPRFLCEVGCGHGHFLTAYAAAHPGTTCIGIDLEEKRIARAVRKRDRAKLTNLHFIRAEAGLFLEALPVSAEISHLFLLFPDPWPKLRHHKHRLIRPAFLAAAAAHAAPGCRLYFRTDYRPYFDDALAVVRDSPPWQPVEEPWPFEFETVFQSRAPSHHSFIARRAPAAP